MSSRMKDVFRRIQEKAGNAKYIIKHKGPNRKERRHTSVEARQKGKTNHGTAKMKPKNWNRDKHCRRVEQKRRRKQSWRV